MRHTFTLSLAMLITSASFTQDLPAIPPDSINLRLDRAAHHHDRSALFRDISLYIGLFGGAMTAIAIHDDTNRNAGMIAGALTIGGFYSFQLVGNGHERKAARALRGQYE